MKTEVVTENELIASFMGWSISRYGGGGYMVPNIYPDKGKWTGEIEFRSEDLEFSERWDWLMPVVEKIANLYADSNHDREWSKAVNDLRMPILSTNINYVYRAVVEFVKWHNQQKK